MKFFRNIFFSIVLLAIAGMFKGCEDFLDKEYDPSLSEYAVFNNATLTRQFLTNIYTNLPDGFAIFANFQFLSASRDAMTDNATSWWGLHYYNMINTDSYTSTNHPLLGFWNVNFNGIRKANQFLKNAREEVVGNAEVGGDDNRLFDRYRAEAILLRAIFHFELVAYFGAAPILEDVILDMDNQEQMRNLTRRPPAEVLEWVAQQCELVMDVLPFVYSSDGNWGRVNGAAAYALRSRALLYRASALNNTANNPLWWQQAADAARGFIDKNASLGNPIRLFHDYGSMFYTSPFLVDEIIFSRSVWNTNYIDTQLLPPGFPGCNGKTNPTQNLVDSYEMINGRFIWEEGSGYNPRRPYENRDPRFAATIFHHGTMWGRADLGQRRAIQVHVNSATDRGADVQGANGGTHTGYFLRKFVNPDMDMVNKGLFPRAWIIFRYAEVLLNYAEALNEAQGPVAAVHDAVNQVRARAGMPALPGGLNQEQMRARIRNERRVELAFEDHRFFDLRRWRAYDNVTYEAELAAFQQSGHFANKLLLIGGMRVQTAGAITRFTKTEVTQQGRRVFNVPKNYLFPIPFNELKRAPNLGQNPGW